jgi:hypothetical protein
MNRLAMQLAIAMLALNPLVGCNSHKQLTSPAASVPVVVFWDLRGNSAHFTNPMTRFT